MELVPIRHDKQQPPLTTELQDNEGNSQDSRGDRVTGSAKLYWKVL